VHLDPAAANALFVDLRDDAVIGSAETAPPAQPPESDTPPPAP